MTRLTAGVAGVLLALVVTGCGESGNSGNSGSSGTATTNTSSEAAGGNAEAVAWAEEMCSSIKDDVAALPTQPQIDQSSPQAIKDSLVSFLDEMGTGFGNIATKLESAGTPPVDQGEEAVQAFLTQITSIQDAVNSAKTKVEAAPVDDPAAFQAAIGAVGEDLSAIGELDTAASFEDYEAFKAAYDEAESCQALEAGSSSGSETPTS